jgi:hypothetical protein
MNMSKTCPYIIMNYFWPKTNEVEVTIYNDDFEDDWELHFYDEFKCGYYDKPKQISDESDDEIEIVEIPIDEFPDYTGEIIFHEE